jgi:hypothetical protein
MTPRGEFRRRLLAAAPEGARVVKRGRHPRLIVERPDGKALSYWFPSTPSDSRRGIKNAVADIRRLMKGSAK